MAPSPEYDKEPKAPDKAVVNISSDDSKVLYNHTKDHSSISELRSTATPANSDVENKHVETLDDGQLRALLDEAITYKCPKDREGKSSLFKELLEEVEQDEEVCEAAVRVLRGGRRGARGRREHHSSLQDLVAAMTAEPAPRRRHHHHSHASSSSSNVSARTHHGGSLPSGVDTSFLLSEEPTRGGYLATVRCVNPPPLAERRVSASDANTSTDELVTRRSKPTFPMTYTARATLEIGSGSVGSGRAVTTTTASNQVRTTTATPRRPAARRPATRRPAARRPAAAGPSPRTIGKPHDPYTNQTKLMSALRKRVDYPCDSGGIVPTEQSNEARPGGKECEPRGSNSKNTNQYNNNDSLNSQWKNSVDKWYESLDNYTNKLPLKNVDLKCNSQTDVPSFTKYKEDASYNTALNDKQQIIFEHGSKSIDIAVNSCKRNDKNVKQKNISNVSKNNNLHSIPYNKLDNKNRVLHLSDNDESDISLRKLYRDRVGNDLVAPNISTIINPKNVRNMTIGKPQSSKDLSVKSSPKGNVNIVLENKETSKVVLEKAITVNAHNPSSENVEIVNDDEKGVAQIENHTSTCKNCSCDSCSSKAKAPEENTNDVPLNFSDDCFKQVDKTENVLEKLIKTYEISQTNDNDEQTPDNNEEISYLVLQDDFMLQLKTEGDGKPFNLAELPNNSYVFLTIPEEFMQAVNNINNQTTIITEIENNNNTSNTKDNNNNKHFEKKSKKRHKKKKKELKTDPNKSDASNKNALKLLLYSDCSDQSAKEQSADSASKTKEVDSAIPFSCITTPEVVASCNTTSTTQSTVAIDPKPLQLESCYRAVSSLTGGAWQPGPAAPPPAAAPAPVPSSAPGAGPTAPATGPADAPAAPPAPAASTAAATVAAHDLLLARNVLTTTTFSGLPLARPSYGSTACSSSDDYKVPILTVHYRLQKSLDENGNAVHGFNSPISGSSQHKKPRRKKSSKNETVIKSHQIDGYQGNKDLNEVLRFIESNADGARGPKMRSKHKDDSDDKGKKRCPDRRKDKENKIKRASSLEELSRTKLEDLTDKPNARRWAAAAPAKPERRSWGDDARAALLLPDDSELTDFQTVTKRRKPRRRADEPEPPGDARPPRRPPTPEPRARRASPSNSNDSNDDVDSVHSLPADAPHTRCKPGPPPPPPAQPATAAALAAAAAAAAAAHASYADIARTRNNIPDLIESCNFYSEGEELKDLTSSPNPKATASAAESMEGYPALATKKPRDKPVQTATRSQRRERAESRTVEPAPDVVADRRPPVILLDSAARPRDMDGVTFGFDINEQLLSCAGGAARRPRCDLLRDAPEEGVAVRAGGAALRYVPPAPPPPPRAAHTQLIVDYVGTAWDDIVRCGSGKVRYFSE